MHVFSETVVTLKDWVESYRVVTDFGCSTLKIYSAMFSMILWDY